MRKNKALLMAALQLMLFSFCGCKSEKFEFKKTKIAVFADNQLTSYQTQGATAYSSLYFRNHLKLCKEENVDVIVINGDLVNNSADSYYEFVDSTIKEIYGDDSSSYPEFVYTMGNHEWYTNDSKENEDSYAITRYKQHARISTDNLVKTSKVEVPLQNETCADFYKVINGIPFISISGCNNGGLLLYDERQEIKSWLEDTLKLPSVKNGGPIFVNYHYPIKNLTYGNGQGCGAYSEQLDELLKDYPQVILFSGDTHYSGVNERSINQVNYTNINLGSSSYSRHISRSATMLSNESYFNLENGSGAKDTLTGPVSENYNKTPHIHLINVDENGNTILNRFFSTNDSLTKIKLGLTWNIPNGVSNDDFIYTSKRYASKEWPNLMYGKDGLNWKDGSELSYSVDSDGVLVNFPDVENYNYCDHYEIEITANTTKKYNFISHYYKWEENPHNYSLLIDSKYLPDGDIIKICVKAFDFFDNISASSLEK